MMSHSSEMSNYKKKNPNYTYSILSVALVLFLLGFFGLFLLHTPKWLEEYKEQVNIMVEVKAETRTEEIRDLTNTLKEIPYIIRESIEFVSKEQIAEEMKEELGTTENTMGISNPFYDMVTFNLEAEYMNGKTLEELKNSVIENQFVKDVFYQELLVDQVNDNLQKIGWVALFLGLLFVVIAAVLIHNTIRLAMYSNRFLIKNMQLVGATWGFITRPYLNRGLVNGIWSGAIAIILLLVVVFFINFQFPDLRLNIWLEDMVSILVVMIGVIIIGVLITYGSTYYVVNKYLKMRLDDLF